MAKRKAPSETTNIPRGSINQDTYPNELQKRYNPLIDSPLVYAFTKARDTDADKETASWKIKRAYVKKVIYDGDNGEYYFSVGTDSSVANAVESMPLGVESDSNAIQKFICYKVYGSAATTPQINQVVEILMPDSEDTSIECRLSKLTSEYVEPVALKSSELYDGTAAQDAFLRPPPPAQYKDPSE